MTADEVGRQSVPPGRRLGAVPPGRREPAHRRHRRDLIAPGLILLLDAAMDRVALPERIRAFFAHRNLSGARDGARTLLEQRGEMRMTPDGKWLPFTAEQYPCRPGF